MTEREPQNPSPDSPWVVLKFGGTSVSTLDCWETIAKVLRERVSEGIRPLVVCSALSQVSNRLEEAIELAVSGTDPRDLVTAIERQHLELAARLGCDVAHDIRTTMEQLANQLTAIAETREASPRLQAEILGVGELLSTRLGAVWLASQGLPTRWLDARELLKADSVDSHDPRRQYLSATCTFRADEGLREKLERYSEPVLITQGFLVGAPNGGTALLGRGGSDTSATYFGQRLDAAHVEIWTDVPGLYSADPRLVPDAQRLRRVGYDEVIELATRGAKVLHPRSLVPARAAGIPIEIRSTRDPSIPGTVIGNDFRVEEPAGLAISSRRGMVVVTMDVELSWQRVGIIAELTSCFAQLGLSIDSIASSQTRVTVSLDPAANPMNETSLSELMVALAEFSEPRLISPVASVSVVGTHLQRVLHAMPSLLHELACRKVYLLTHAANDHSLTFVVNESESDDLVRALHADLLRSELGVPEEVSSRQPGGASSESSSSDSAEAAGDAG
jgi:diaminopimelate decarboxylase/aspartate kinase